MPLANGFLKDVTDQWVAAGVATGVGTDIFANRAAVLPKGDGPYLSIVLTGGGEPAFIQNLTTPAWVYPTAQIVARAKSPSVALAKLVQAYNALVGIRNATLGTTFYQYIHVNGEPTDLGPDDAERTRYSINISAKKNPSS